MPDVGILIIDDDAPMQEALHQMLDSEGWRVAQVPDAARALVELTQGPWRLVIANVAVTGVDTTLFATLVELGQAEAAGGPQLLRVLFLVPEDTTPEVQKAIEVVHAPYALKPLHLHDFLDKISDLLMDTGAIAAPIRRVRGEEKPTTRVLRNSQRPRGAGAGGRQTSMFAARKEYMMSEEELIEFERQEEEERKKKQKKPGELGNL